MDLRFFVARKEQREIYSMETIINIILAPWTFFQWIFSIVVWYYVISLVFSKGDQLGFDRFMIRKYAIRMCDWIEDCWDALRNALRFGK